MSKSDRVQISKLKPSLSKYLRAAQKGHVTTVLDRDTPIAVIAPVSSDAADPLDVIPAVFGPEAFQRIEISAVRGRVDSVALLLEERGER